MGRHGDLLVFGTQSHGSPAMPDISGRRVSVVIFYRPDADNLERRWRTVDETNDGQDDADIILDASKVFNPLSKAHGADALSENFSPLSKALVDYELCGCPGISLGLVSRRLTCISAPVTILTIGCGRLEEVTFFKRLS